MIICSIHICNWSVNNNNNCTYELTPILPLLFGKPYSFDFKYLLLKYNHTFVVPYLQRILKQSMNYARVVYLWIFQRRQIIFSLTTFSKVQGTNKKIRGKSIQLTVDKLFEYSKRNILARNSNNGTNIGNIQSSERCEGFDQCIMKILRKQSFPMIFIPDEY